MNTKKLFKKYAWLFVLLCIALYFFVFRYNSGTINPASKKFAIADTSIINRIVLSNDSITVTLSRTEKGWMIDNNYTVRTDAIKALMNVISLVEIGSPVPTSVADSLVKEIKRNGQSIQIYSGDELLKEYSVLPTRTMGLGTIGKLKKYNKSFTLNLPGFKGNLASLFVINPDYWKSNRLFIADVKQITKIDVELPNHPEKSFCLTLDDRGLKLRATYFDRNIEQFDTSQVVNFIIGLTNLSYEKLLSKSSIEDRAAIVLSQPEQIFTITLTNGKKLVLKTYPMPVDEYRDEFGRTVKFDLNRLYISFNNDAIIAIATYMVFDPVLKDLSSFRLKNN